MDAQDDIRDRLSGIQTELRGMNSTLVRNTVSLEEHMKRTEASEVRLGRVENWLVGLLSSGLLAMLTIIVKLFT